MVRINLTLTEQTDHLLKFLATESKMSRSAVLRDLIKSQANQTILSRYTKLIGGEDRI